MEVRKSEVRNLQCPVCDRIFQRRIFFNDKDRRRYCSTECKKNDSAYYSWDDAKKIEYSEKMKGENNPNYGNKWNEVDKQKASERVKKLYENHPEYREIAGRANRGVKFDEERRKQISLARAGKPGKPHSEESKKKIGIKSKEKWTIEYLEAHRIKMEKLGHWIPRECKSGYEVYHEEANWLGSMIDYFDEESLSNLKTHGIFNPYTNKKGYVRDHIFGRVWGYFRGIPACILRHPVNLKFISHRDNIKKGFSDRTATLEKIEIELQLLIDKILEYRGNWSEHSKCLEYIQQLKEGQREV